MSFDLDEIVDWELELNADQLIQKYLDDFRESDAELLSPLPSPPPSLPTPNGAKRPLQSCNKTEFSKTKRQRKGNQRV